MVCLTSFLSFFLLLSPSYFLSICAWLTIRWIYADGLSEVIFFTSIVGDRGCEVMVKFSIVGKHLYSVYAGGRAGGSMKSIKDEIYYCWCKKTREDNRLIEIAKEINEQSICSTP